MTCKDCMNEPNCLPHILYSKGKDWNNQYTPDIEKRCKLFKKKADMVEVVRCKECVNWAGVVLGNVCKRWSSPLGHLINLTSPDDYCSYGERIENK